MVLEFCSQLTWAARLGIFIATFLQQAAERLGTLKTKPSPPMSLPPWKPPHSRMEKFSFRKDPVNRYTHPEAIIEFEPTIQCNYIEILQYVRGGTCKAVCNEGGLDDGNINGWLDKVGIYETHSFFL